jgi:hypothetical protein
MLRLAKMACLAVTAVPGVWDRRRILRAMQFRTGVSSWAKFQFTDFFSEEKEVSISKHFIGRFHHKGE